MTTTEDYCDVSPRTGVCATHNALCPPPDAVTIRRMPVPTNNVDLTSGIDIQIAMLDVAGAAFQAEAGFVRLLHQELLITTEQRDALVADALALMSERQTEVFAR